MRLRFAPAAMRLALTAAAAPQPGSEHPTPQRLRMHGKVVVRSAVFGGQPRPEPFVRRATVRLPHHSHYALAKRGRLGLAGYTPDVAMHQASRSGAPIAPPQPFHLAVADLQALRRCHQLQLPALDPRSDPGKPGADRRERHCSETAPWFQYRCICSVLGTFKGRRRRNPNHWASV